MNFNSVLIASEDPGRLSEYYTKLFGPPGWDHGGFKSWQIGSGWLTISPYPTVSGKSSDAGRVMWNIETPNFQADFDRLKAAGATLVREPFNPGGLEGAQVATFADQDGNQFQLMTPMM